MSCVNIRGCRIGEGRPKVILPIVERTEAAILEKAAQFSALPADCPLQPFHCILIFYCIAMCLYTYTAAFSPRLPAFLHNLE